MISKTLAGYLKQLKLREARLLTQHTELRLVKNQ
jgi:hypothetical protein